MDLSQATKNLIYRSPFFGHIALGLQKEFSDRVPTACAQIQGINIGLYFNEDFWNKLNDKHQIGLLEHELGHVCLFHLIHYHEYDDKEVANLAADMVINQYIDADYLPPNGMLPSSFPELNLEPFKDTRYYYEAMMKDLQQNGGGKSPKLKALTDYMKAGNMTVSSHPLWGTDGEGNVVSDAIRDLVKAQIEHQIKEVYEEQMNKNPGNIPGYLKDMVTNMYMKKPPVVDWRVVVRQFKSFCDKQNMAFTRSRPNKRYPDSDAVTLRQRRKMLVGLDTSGSISPSLLCEFFTQVGHMAKHGVEIDVVEWDFGIQRIYEFDARNPWKAGEVKGGGGTNPYEVIEMLNKSRNHHAALMFTDGYIGGEWKKISKPVLWIICKGGSDKFEFPGKKIIIDQLS